MAVRLRLMRMGKKKQPTYRVVAADSRSPRDGRFIEILGTYQPRLEPSGVQIDNDRAVHWLSVGAQPSEAVQKLLTISGAMAQFKGEEFVPSVPPAAKETAEPVKPAAAKEEAKPEVAEEAVAETPSEAEVVEEAPEEDAKDES
ncbi:MAG: 30S ribosomal protein S16 [Actinobacteria bacterium]|nr:30S ribosomal protein S16 [Actinomycetota bacterium]